jgi:hypothetical protein
MVHSWVLCNLDMAMFLLGQREQCVADCKC